MKTEDKVLPEDQEAIARGLKEVAGILETCGVPFILEGVDRSPDNCKVNARKYGARYERLGWYLKGPYRRHRRYRLPRRYLEDRVDMRFMGYSFPVPRDSEGYLRFSYGDWKVPEKSAWFFADRLFDQRYLWTLRIKKGLRLLLGKKHEI